MFSKISFFKETEKKLSRRNLHSKNSSKSQQKSLKEKPKSIKKQIPSKKNLEIATLAGGCFWCLESDLEKLSGVQEVISGYTGGKEASPNYKEVSSGKTGHVEAVQVTYDPKKLSYSQLLDVFWRKINPTDKEGQFVDRGSQYLPAIFYHNDKQKQEALKSKKELQEKGPFKEKIVTSIHPFKTFYKAEEYHQDYYKKNKLKYTYYRFLSGRDQFLKKKWGSFKDFRLSLKKEKHSLEKSKKEIENLNKNPKSISPFSSYKLPSEKELKTQLSPMEYKVIRENGTEPPFQNKYWDHKKSGIYVDKLSGEPLFSSLDKYDSGTGWPSFKKPLRKEHIVVREDRSLFSLRTEVRSKYGDSHLGHVFPDGPAPLGLRYCINSASLRFISKNKLKGEGYGEFLNLFYP